jgi:hypothetical protein
MRGRRRAAEQTAAQNEREAKDEFGVHGLLWFIQQFFSNFAAKEFCKTCCSPDSSVGHIRDSQFQK